MEYARPDVESDLRPSIRRSGHDARVTAGPVEQAEVRAKRAT
jgi:hypothetical protein